MAAAIRTALSIRTEANDAWSRIGSGSAIEWRLMWVRSAMRTAAAAKPQPVSIARCKPAVAAAGAVAPTARSSFVRAVESAEQLAKPRAPPICCEELSKPLASPGTEDRRRRIDMHECPRRPKRGSELNVGNSNVRQFNTIFVGLPHNLLRSRRA
jgi:hypothetical protein